MKLAASLGFVGKTCWAFQCQFALMRDGQRSKQLAAQGNPRSNDELVKQACAFCPRYGQPGCESLTSAFHSK